jgi:hypothetical protein
VRRAHCLPVIALGAAVVGALVAVARGASTGPDLAELEAIAADLERGLAGSAAGVRARAGALAALPRLTLAVATDSATVGDLTDEELALERRPDETIELAQAPRAGGAPVSLRRWPAGAQVVVPLASPGLHLVGGESPRLASVVRFRPGARADELDGVVAVSWPAGLEPATARLAALGSGAALETASGPIALGGRVDDSRGTIAMTLTGPDGQSMRLVVPAPGTRAWQRGPLSAACGIALGVLAACFLICRTAGSRDVVAGRTPARAGHLSRTWTPPPPPSPYPPQHARQPTVDRAPGSAPQWPPASLPEWPTGSMPEWVADGRAGRRLPLQAPDPDEPATIPRAPSPRPRG